jgi:hypothetical protein
MPVPLPEIGGFHIVLVIAGFPCSILISSGIVLPWPEILVVISSPAAALGSIKAAL